MYLTGDNYACKTDKTGLFSGAKMANALLQSEISARQMAPPFPKTVTNKKYITL